MYTFCLFNNKVVFVIMIRQHQINTTEVIRINFERICHHRPTSAVCFSRHWTGENAGAVLDTMCIGWKFTEGFLLFTCQYSLRVVTCVVSA